MHSKIKRVDGSNMIAPACARRGQDQWETVQTKIFMEYKGETRMAKLQRRPISDRRRKFICRGEDAKDTTLTIWFSAGIIGIEHFATVAEVYPQIDMST
jgi:hypothetical protein